EPLLGELGIEMRLLRDRPQPGDLLTLASGVRGWHPARRLEPADRLGGLEPLGEQVDERRIDVVDALPVAPEFGTRVVGRLGGGGGHRARLPGAARRHRLPRRRARTLVVSLLAALSLGASAAGDRRSRSPGDTLASSAP